jgi:peptide/nickel transport system ATP-binding protein/oligopeptide transport system ATP-binding protein
VDNLLEVKDLKTHFFTDRGVVKAVDGVGFTLNKGETLGLVGESGSGKTVTALSILRLISSPPGKIVSGSIRFNGKELLELKPDQIRKIRGKDIAMIFQEPMTSLNPVFTISNQIIEAIRLHQDVTRRQARERMLELLDIVGIPSPGDRANDYPHQFSGGMRQRVMIAMAISSQPSLLIADEPTSALDVTIQAQILELLSQLQEKFGMAILLITHDFGIVAQMASNVVVMYEGKIVEYGDVYQIFEQPSHPYTRELLSCLKL